MPGTPDPVLGSDALTLVVALLGAVPAAVLPVVLVRRDRLPEPRWTALLAGVAYGVGFTLLWATVLALFRPVDLPPSNGYWLVALAPVVIGLQAAIPWYAYARRRLVLPLVALFGLTTLVLFLCLRVAGESDGYLLYTIFGGLYVLPGLCLLAAVEIGVRGLRERLGDDGSDSA